MKFYITAEYEANELFDSPDEINQPNINWLYCKQQASFVHKDKDACEFILTLFLEETEYFSDMINDMRKFGCTEDFIKVVIQARDFGASRLLLYV